MKPVKKSSKLNGVCYDIRGPVLSRANQLEEEGHRIIKLNIGNPAPFGFEAPEEILVDTIHNLPEATGYCDSHGLYSARKAIMQETQLMGIKDVEIDDIYIGNGVSELIVMAMQALLENGDEVLIPAPDYPLWTASVKLGGGKPVHYLCDPENEWNPDLQDIRSKITSNTRAIVIINPNNPTGAVYSRDVLEGIMDLAREHELIVLSDEIYDKILYDDAKHIPSATLCEDLLCITFNGLSKTYRVAGFRSGWMYLTGRKDLAADYIEGLDMLSSMRLCANVPAQYAIQTALGGYQSIRELTAPEGRLCQQRDYAWEKLNSIPGVTCVKPKSALYLFPSFDRKLYKIDDDEQLVLDLLNREKVLIVHGRAFNWPDTDHFRIVFLPGMEELATALERIENYLEDRRA